jgi:hypothetical protein
MIHLADLKGQKRAGSAAIRSAIAAEYSLALFGCGKERKK